MRHPLPSGLAPWALPTAFLTLLLAAAPAAADHHTYLGASAGTRFDNGVSSGPGQPETDHEMLKLFFGVTLTERWSLEAGYHRFSDTTCCSGTEAGNAAGLTSRFREQLDGYSAALVATVPRERLEIFAKAGLLWWESQLSQQGPFVAPGFAETSRDGRSWMAGFGAAWRLAPRWRLRAEYELFDISADTLTAGVQFNF